MAAAAKTGRSAHKHNCTSKVDRFEGRLEANEENFEFENDYFVEGDTPIIHNVPTEICADSLLGKVPQSANILRTDVVERLTSKYEWKSVRAILTAGCLYLTRPDEDLVRDLIPLCEVVSLRRINDGINNGSDESGVGDGMPDRSESMRSVLSFAFLNGSTKRDCIIQLQTMKDGFNSGRTYYVAAPTDTVCRAWEAALRAAVDAILRKRFALSFIGRVRLRLRRHGPHQIQLSCNSAAVAFAHRVVRRNV